MGPSAMWMAVASAVRRTWAGAVVVGVLLGLVGGIVAAALWGADRVETAYERLANDVDAPDLALVCDQPCVGPGSASEQLRAEPAVDEVAVVLQQFVAIQTAVEREGQLVPSGRYLGLEPTDECATGPGEIDLTWSEWPRTGNPPARIVDGRLPDPVGVNEVALSSITARRSGIEVGDTVFLTAGCGGEDTLRLDAPIELKVVGALVGFLDVRPPGQTEFFENVYAGRELIEQTGIEIQFLLAAWLHPGTSAADLSPEAAAGIAFVLDAHSRDVGEDLRADASALRLFAVAAILGAIAVLSQLLSLSVRSAVAVNRPLTLLGARRRDLASLGLVHGALIGATSAIAAFATAAIGAQFVPAGAADPIDQGTDVGLAMSLGLLAAAATLTAVSVLAMPPSWLAARAVRGKTLHPRPHRLPGRGAEALHLAPAAALGTRFALEPASGPRPVPIRSGLVAITVSLAVVTGVITFTSGLEHLRTTPRLVGWNWDLWIWADDGEVEDLAQAISERPEVERSGAGILLSWYLSMSDDFVAEFGAPEAIMGFDARANSVQPVVLEGRTPEGPDELLLAPGLADLYGLSVGDETVLYTPNPLVPLAIEMGVPLAALEIQEIDGERFEVVGTGVIPVFDGRLDHGGALTLDGFARALPQPNNGDLLRLLDLGDQEFLWQLLLDEQGPAELTPAEHRQLSRAGPDGMSGVLAAWSDEQITRLIPFDSAAPQGVFVDIVDGQSPRTVLQRFADDGLVSDDYVDEFFDRGDDELSPEDLVKLDLSDVGWIPSSFAFLMGMTALSALSFVVTTAARARRDDLARLRALGLSPRQTRATVAWQSLVTVAVSMVVALPLGVIGGRIAWDRYATGLQVVPEPITPWVLLTVLVAVTFAVALIVAAIPGWHAARQSPLESLRSE